MKQPVHAFEISYEVSLPVQMGPDDATRFYF